MGTEAATRTCSLSRIWTGNLPVHGSRLNHWTTPAGPVHALPHKTGGTAVLIPDYQAWALQAFAYMHQCNDLVHRSWGLQLWMLTIDIIGWILELNFSISRKISFEGIDYNGNEWLLILFSPRSKNFRLIICLEKGIGLQAFKSSERKKKIIHIYIYHYIQHFLELYLIY